MVNKYGEHPSELMMAIMHYRVQLKTKLYNGIEIKD